MATHGIAPQNTFAGLQNCLINCKRFVVSSVFLHTFIRKLPLQFKCRQILIWLHFGNLAHRRVSKLAFLSSSVWLHSASFEPLWSRITSCCFHIVVFISLEMQLRCTQPRLQDDLKGAPTPRFSADYNWSGWVGPTPADTLEI